MLPSENLDLPEFVDVLSHFTDKTRFPSIRVLRLFHRDRSSTFRDSEHWSAWTAAAYVSQIVLEEVFMLD
jgi:hypothetical protein